MSGQAVGGAAIGIERLSEIIEFVRVAPLRPGDVVVVRLATPHVCDELRARVAHDLRSIFGDNKILVTAQDADIEIVRPDAKLPERMCGVTLSICVDGCDDRPCRRAP